MNNFTVNDVTQINPISVREIFRPASVEQLQQRVRAHEGPISIGGGRYSMGGQIATDDALFIDMQGLDGIVDYSKDNKAITVQTGATWRKIIGHIDPDDLSVSVMQSFSNFTVGGALSVNCHGRYVGGGPIITTVKSIKAVTADGTLVTASPQENSRFFFGAIGGYGGLGIITEATLALTDNTNLKRQVVRMSRSAYGKYFNEHIRDDKEAVMHNADFYPPGYDTVTAVTYRKTGEPVTVRDRLRPWKPFYVPEYLALFSMTQIPGVGRLRPHIDDKIRLVSDEVVKRNYEACHYVEELEPMTRAMTTYVLQEYFVPVNKFDPFAEKMTGILQRHDVNTVNVSIRHAHKDPGSVMAWAQHDEVFAFVLYYKQWNYERARQHVGVWTRTLIDAATDYDGTYYLPYQPHATEQQFRKSYSRADEFFELKNEYDPTNKFRNRLWDKYYSYGPKIDPETPRFRQSRGYGANGLLKNLRS